MYQELGSDRWNWCRKLRELELPGTILSNSVQNGMTFRGQDPKLFGKCLGTFLKVQIQIAWNGCCIQFIRTP